MPKQPQAQISAALGSLRDALAAEPEMADRATLQHAVNLVQRVYDKNKTEGGSVPPAPVAKDRSYAEIADRTMRS